MAQAHLESSFQRSGIVVTTPKDKQAVLMFQLLSQFLHLSIQSQYLQHIDDTEQCHLYL